MGLSKAGIYSDKYGVKSVRFLLFFAALAQLESARANPVTATSNCFRKAFAASQAVAKGAKEGVQAHVKEIKDSKGLRLLVKDPPQKFEGEERWHGLWQRPVQTTVASEREAAQVLVLEEEGLSIELFREGALEELPVPEAKSLAERVDGGLEKLSKATNDKLQAGPRAASRKLFKKDGEPWSGSYDLHPSYLGNAVMRAFTKKAFGKEKELSGWVTLPAYTAASVVAWGAVRDQVDHWGREQVIDKIYATSIGKDPRYAAIASAEKSGKISHHEAREQAYARYNALMDRQNLGLTLKDIYDQGKHPLFGTKTLDAFNPVEKREVLVQADALTKALDDYRYRTFGELARRDLAQTGGDPKRILQVIETSRRSLAHIRETEDQYLKSLDKNDYDPAAPVDARRIDRVLELLGGTGDEAHPALRYPQFAQDLLWFSQGLPAEAPAGFVYPAGKPASVNPMRLENVAEDRVVDEQAVRSQRLSDLVGANELRLQTFKIIEVALENRDEIPEVLSQDFAGGRGADPFVQKVGQLWREKKIDRKGAQNALMEYADEIYRYQEYDLLGVRPLQEVPGSPGRYTNQYRTIPYVREELLRKLAR